MLPLATQNFSATGLARSVVMPQPENIRLIPSLQIPSPSAQLREQLPISATPNDLRNIIRFLKQRPDGISIIEALGEVKKRLLDPSKIATYEQWGIISRQGDWLKLSSLGWEFSKKLGLEADLFRTILDQQEPYRAMLEHACFQRLSLITHDDVAKYWRVNFPHSLDWQSPKTVESAVVSFLHLCQSAELGTLTIGKRGQPARLSVDFEDLESYLNHDRDAFTETIFEDVHALKHTLTAVAKKHEKSRLYLSLSEVTAEMMDLKNLLELLGFECHIAERIQQVNDQLTEKSFEPLKTCNAGIIVITEADCSVGMTGNLILSPEIQMEIGAAYLLYDRRIILLRERGIDVPEYWKNITTFELNNSRFDWQQGLALTKILLTL
jgi:hypothetical protein